MSSKSKIEWTNATWNPLRGTKGKWFCSHASEGCRFCYAERINIRFRGPEYKRGLDTFRLDENILIEPLKWKKPRMVFVCSMTDLFHEDVPDEFIHKVFAIIALSTHQTFQILTKRSKRMMKYMNSDPWNMWSYWMGRLVDKSRMEFIGRGFDQATDIAIGKNWPLRNCWLGVSAENQENYNKRIIHLLKTPARIRFLSLEPLLGPINIFLSGFKFDWNLNVKTGERTTIHWILLGGESGKDARPCNVQWMRDIVKQCKAAKIKCFVKQLGSNPGFRPEDEEKNGNPGPSFDHYDHEYGLYIKKMDTFKGTDFNNFPEELKIREYPIVKG